MDKIKIGFSDFWPGFNPFDNWFTRKLDKKYNIEISNSPEILFYSVFSHEYLNFDGIRVFYTGENRRPNLWEADYALSYDLIDHPRHCRLPLYVLYDSYNPEDLLFENKLKKISLNHKSKFCCFIVSNGKAKKRVEFYNKLSNYKKVDSGGRYLNNIGRSIDNKISFLQDYKFVISFENDSFPGYTTEKIYEPMFTNTIPIYWGNSKVNFDFNTQSFLNYHDFGSDMDLINRIILLDQNDEEYNRMLHQPWFNNNTISKYFTSDYIYSFFDKIFYSSGSQVSVKWRKKIGILRRKYYSIKKRFYTD